MYISSIGPKKWNKSLISFSLAWNDKLCIITLQFNLSFWLVANADNLLTWIIREFISVLSNLFCTNFTILLFLNLIKQTGSNSENNEYGYSISIDSSNFSQ